MCTDESATSRAWAQACLAFGELQTEHNETTVARSLSYSMREQALTAIGDMEGAAEVAEERALFNAQAAQSRSLAEVHAALILAKPERFHAYIGAIQEFGETAGARVFGRQELPLLLERAGLLDREGAQECVAQFFDPQAVVGTQAATFRGYYIEEYPLRVGDQLQISVRGIGTQSTWRRQVGQDGLISMPRIPGIATVGKTTGQLQREISTILSDSYGQPVEAYVTLISSPRSPEERRLEFDNALEEALEKRDEPL